METEKLAEWAGFKYIYKATNGGWYYYVYQGGENKPIPNFTQSLDACFKWFGPKLEMLGLEYKLFSDCGMHFCHITKPDPETENHVLVSTGGYVRAVKAICRPRKALNGCK